MHKIKLHKTSKCLWPIYIDTFVVKWIFFCFFLDIFINHFPKIRHSILQGISATLKHWPHPFLTSPFLHPLAKKILNLSDPCPTPFWGTPLQNFGELDSRPWNVPSSKKVKTYFKKKQQIVNNWKEHLWMLKLGFF